MGQLNRESLITDLPRSQRDELLERSNGRAMAQDRFWMTESGYLTFHRKYLLAVDRQQTGDTPLRAGETRS